MKNIHEFNEKALNYLRKIECNEDLSNPLLISPKCSGKIMYVGQETNCWQGGLRDNEYKVIELEELYYEKFFNSNFKNTLFWKFVREIYEKYNVSDDIIWTNVLLVGKKDSIGKPLNSDRIRDISIENLISIYENFNIEKIICVAGPNNPYYDVFTSFLDEIGKTISGYPCKEQTVVYSDDKKAAYLYHPQYLWRNDIYDDVVDEMKLFIKK